MDAKILENRLLTRESVLYSSSVSKCATRLQQYLNSLNDGTMVQESRESLLREISLYRHEMSQVTLAVGMCERELVEFQALERDIEDEISTVQANISRLTQELAEQRSIRRHKEECEMIARLVNTLPARSLVTKEITRAEEAVAKLRDQTSVADSKVNMRTKQWQLLLQTVLDMQKNLAEDEEQQTLVTAMETAYAQEEEDQTGGQESDAEDGEEGTGRGRERDEGGVSDKKPRLEIPDLGAEDGEIGETSGDDKQTALLGSEELLAETNPDDGGSSMVIDTDGNPNLQQQDSA
jgi:THO complex subunit 7